ncbi:hypothetical protein NRS6107_21120 (plasmid) [Bacillus subtilis]|nr:hypothetical protein NRS6107_21120 [Bacillus subtilis]
MAAAGAPGQDARNRLTKVREYGQASAEPAAGIQDLQGWPQPEHQGKMPGTGRQRPQIWPSFSRAGGRDLEDQNR